MCCIYRNKEEQMSALSSFMSVGVKRGEKCLYIVDDRTKKEVIRTFKKLNFEVEKFIDDGQFEFMTKTESYVKDGRFDPDKMIDLLDKRKKDALKKGYEGLRVTGEMTWFFGDIPGVERLMEYESKLNEFLPDNEIIALCQYNEERFSSEILVNVIRTHPKVVLYDTLHQNPYFMPPRIFKAQLEDEVTSKHYEKMKDNIITRTRLKKGEEKAKKKLRKERDRARKYLKTAEVMLITIDPEGKVIQANRKASEVLGYEKDEIIGKDWFENFIPEDQKDELRKLHKKVGRTDYSEYFENPVITKSGEKRDILWHNSFLEDEEGTILGTLSSGMDITERKEHQERIRELSQFRERIIQDANIWLNVLDKNANVMVWNRAAEKISGYSKEEVVGDNKIWEWLYPDQKYRERIVEKVTDILEGEELESYETTIHCKDGQEKIISWSSHPLRNEEGEIIGSVALGKDITSEKRSEERKEFMNTLVRKDIRSKFNLIQGYLKLIEDVDLPEEHREYLQRAIDIGEKTDEILKLAGKLDHFEDVDWSTEKRLPKLLEHLLEDIRGYADNKKVDVDYKEKDVKIQYDDSLNVLLSQLIKTRIQTSNCEEIIIDVEEIEGDKIAIIIEDDGEDLTKDIKDLFTGDLYTGETSGAGGVNYYILKQIADQIDLDIDIKSQDERVKFIIKMDQID